MSVTATACDHCPTREAQAICDVCRDVLCFGCAIPVALGGPGGRRRVVLCGACFDLHSHGHAVLVGPPTARGQDWPLVAAGLALLAAPFGLVNTQVGFAAFVATHLLAVPAFIGALVQLDQVAKGARSEGAQQTLWLAVGVAVLSMVAVSAGTWFGVLLEAI